MAAPTIGQPPPPPNLAMADSDPPLLQHETAITDEYLNKEGARIETIQNICSAETTPSQVETQQPPLQKASFKSVLLSDAGNGSGTFSTGCPGVTSQGFNNPLFTTDEEMNENEVFEDQTTHEMSKKGWKIEDIKVGKEGLYNSITIPNSIIEQLAKPWKRSVVVKLFGRKMGYAALKNRIRVLWKPVGDYHVVDLDNDYFIVRFELENDWSRALLDGPWTVMGSYLLVQPWRPDFKVDEGISYLTVWVRFPELPIHCYNKEILGVLASIVGELVKVDLNTKEANRGKFARVAVKLDLNKPLVDRFTMNGELYRIEYEGINLMCLNCGKVGHTKADCIKGREATHQHEQQLPTEKNIEVVSNSWQAVKNGAHSNQFGEWMQAQSRRRRPNNISRTTNANSFQTGGANIASLNQKGGVDGGKQPEVHAEGETLDQGSRFRLLEEEERTVTHPTVNPKETSTDLIAQTNEKDNRKVTRQNRLTINTRKKQNQRVARELQFAPPSKTQAKGKQVREKPVKISGNEEGKKQWKVVGVLSHDQATEVEVPGKTKPTEGTEKEDSIQNLEKTKKGQEGLNKDKRQEIFKFTTKSPIKMFTVKKQNSPKVRVKLGKRKPDIIDVVEMLNRGTSVTRLKSMVTLDRPPEEEDGPSSLPPSTSTESTHEESEQEVEPENQSMLV